MSIVNVWMERGRGLLAVDTRAENDSRHLPGGSYVQHDAAKMIVLPHAHMVLANRGDLAFFQWFNGTLVTEPFSWSIDLFAERAAALCDEIYRARMAQFAALYANRPFETEIYAVGWSEKLQEVVCYLCHRDQGASQFTCERVESWCAAPQAHDVWPTAERTPPFDTEPRMIAAAREQVRYFRSLHPDRPIGGKLILASVTRGGIETRTVADLG